MDIAVREKEIIGRRSNSSTVVKYKCILELQVRTVAIPILDKFLNSGDDRNHGVFEHAILGDAFKHDSLEKRSESLLCKTPENAVSFVRVPSLLPAGNDR